MLKTDSRLIDELIGPPGVAVSGGHEDVPEHLWLLQMRRMRREVEPGQLFGWCLHRVVEAFSGIAGSHLVEAALHHDDRDVEPGQGADEIRVCELRNQRSLPGADSSERADDVCGGVVGKTEQ